MLLTVSRQFNRKQFKNDIKFDLVELKSKLDIQLLA